MKSLINGNYCTTKSLAGQFSSIFITFIFQLIDPNVFLEQGEFKQCVQKTDFAIFIHFNNKYYTKI